MKIAFGMIVFEGDYVLNECLEQVYPFASQILISEGPVQYWQNKGKTTSEDKTNEILNNFYDPDKKIKIIHGQFKEKDEQCKAYMNYIDPDTDYIWNLDSDEVFKTNDLIKMKDFLIDEAPTSVGIQSCTFYGGFDYFLTGFETKVDNFLRIFKYQNGANWKTHRPPTIEYKTHINRKHINSLELFEKTNIQMYHYSYVFPNQVYKKISYYKDAVSGNNCIDNYFHEVYLPWITSNTEQKNIIEKKYDGVHEFKPHIRGSCKTSKFTGSHPESIIKNLNKLKDRFEKELLSFMDK